MTTPDLKYFLFRFIFAEISEFSCLVPQKIWCRRTSYTTSNMLQDKIKIPISQFNHFYLFLSNCMWTGSANIWCRGT